MTRLTVFYDGRCPICRREMLLDQQYDIHGRIDGVDLHAAPERLAALGIKQEEAMRLMHAVREDGSLIIGLPAIRAKYRLFERPGLNALVSLSELPLLRGMLDQAYVWFARNRYRFPAWLLPAPRCADGTCKTSRD